VGATQQRSSPPGAVSDEEHGGGSPPPPDDDSTARAPTPPPPPSSDSPPPPEVSGPDSEGAAAAPAASSAFGVGPPPFDPGSLQVGDMVDVYDVQVKDWYYSSVTDAEPHRVRIHYEGEFSFTVTFHANLAHNLTRSP
jgi:hypothetical protein